MIALQVNTHILNMKMRRSEASERLKEVLIMHIRTGRSFVSPQPYVNRPLCSSASKNSRTKTPKQTNRSVPTTASRVSLPSPPPSFSFRIPASTRELSVVLMHCCRQHNGNVHGRRLSSSRPPARSFSRPRRRLSQAAFRRDHSNGEAACYGSASPEGTRIVHPDAL